MYEVARSSRRNIDYVFDCCRHAGDFCGCGASLRFWLSAGCVSGFFTRHQHGLGAGAVHYYVLFVWMAKFGAAYGVRQGIHVGVDVLVNRLSPDRQRIMTSVALSAGILFTGIVAMLGARMVWENGLAYVALNALGLGAAGHYEGPTTPDLEWPTWIVYLAVPLGSSLMCFRFVQVLLNFWRTGDPPRPRACGRVG